MTDKLKLDVDVHYVFPQELYQDKAVAQKLEELGMNLTSASNCLIMFRYEKTAQALRGAHPLVQKLFVDSGFGLQASGAKLQHKTLLARDHGAINVALERLSENLPDLEDKNISAEDWNGVDPIAVALNVLESRAVGTQSGATIEKGPEKNKRPLSLPRLVILFCLTYLAFRVAIEIVWPR